MEAFRVREGRGRGLGVGALRGPGFAAPFWGIRTRTMPDGPVERAASFAPRMPRRAFFCGVTAAALWGIPLPRRRTDETELHVGVVAGDRRIEASGIRAHHLTLGPAEVTTLRGLRVTTMVRTWRDLATAGLTRAELVAAGDHVLRRSRPADVARAVAAAAGQRGAARLRDAHALLDPRARSAPESELRIAMLEAGLPHPRINRRIHSAAGAVLGRPDFSWPQHRVVVEYEGEHHRTDADQWRQDLLRFARFQEHGWVALRASADDYRDPVRLLAQLARVLAARERT